MNEYVSRSDLTQVDRVSPRAPAPLRAVQPVSSTQQAAPDLDENKAASRAPAEAIAPLSDDDLASAAEYAKMHARVADILAQLRSTSTESSLDGAEADMQALLPAPMILVPLPPASKEAIESAVMLGKRIAEQASYAHAAQAHMKRGMVDQLLSAG